MADFTVTQAKRRLTRVLQEAQAGRPVRVTRHGAVIFDSSETVYPPQAGEPLSFDVEKVIREMRKRTSVKAKDYIRKARDAARR